MSWSTFRLRINWFCCAITCVGAEFELWNGVLGRHGVGKCNANGSELLTLCAEFHLWYSLTTPVSAFLTNLRLCGCIPRSQHWHLLDYVIVQKSDLQNVHIRRAMRGAQGRTNHRLIQSKPSMTLKGPQRSFHKTPAKLDVTKLVHSKDLQKVLDDTFGAIPSAAAGVSVDKG